MYHHLYTTVYEVHTHSHTQITKNRF